jgi:hypothetical protein
MTSNKKAEANRQTGLEVTTNRTCSFVRTEQALLTSLGGFAAATGFFAVWGGEEGLEGSPERVRADK